MNRNLGTSEILHWLLNKISPFNLQAILHVKGNMTLTAVEAALKNIQQMQPLLRTSIVSHNNEAKFIPCHHKIPLKILDNFQDDKYAGIAKKELGSSIIVKDLPLIRVVWLKGDNKHLFILTISHIIAGGVELGYLANDFVKACDAISNNYSFTTTSFPSRPPIEELLPPINLQKKNPKPPKNVNIHSKKNAPANPTSFNDFQLTTDVSEKLHRLAKKHQTSIHGITCAIATKAFETCLNGEHPEQPLSAIRCISPLNLRPHLPIKIMPNELGLRITGVSVTIKNPSQIPTWSLAKHIKQKITTFTENKEYIPAIHQEKNILETYKSPENISHFYNQSTSPQIIVTNLGVINPPQNMLSLKLINISICGGGLGSKLDNPQSIGLMVYSFHGCLRFAITYVDPTITRQKTEKLKEIITEQIHHL